MNNKHLLIIVLILGFIALISRSKSNPSTNFYEKEKNVEISIKNPDTEEIKEVNLEEYVLGVVAAEMPASFEMEALKAQAIAARTYAAYKMQHTTKDYDVLTDISNQAYITDEQMHQKWEDDYSLYYARVKNAVEETKDKVMYYDNDIIIAYYFSMSNGYTEEASLVFGSKEDYLVSVDSAWDRGVKNFEVTKEFSQDEFCQKLSLDCSTLKISSIKRSATNRVNTITINDKTFKGTNFRSLLGLRSTDFDITLSNVITITTRGYGHGVGMSQYGANEMAKQGYTYEEILKYYYHDVNLNEVNV